MRNAANIEEQIRKAHTELTERNLKWKTSQNQEIFWHLVELDPQKKKVLLSPVAKESWEPPWTSLVLSVLLLSSHDFPLLPEAAADIFLAKYNIIIHNSYIPIESIEWYQWYPKPSFQLDVLEGSGMLFILLHFYLLPFTPKQTHIYHHVSYWSYFTRMPILNRETSFSFQWK